MRKAIILMALFMGVSLHSQIKVENKIVFHAKSWKKDSVYFYRPFSFLKLSAKPVLDVPQALSLLSDIPKDNTDFLNIGNLDVRMKIYILKNVSLVFGSHFSGLDSYYYTTGVVIKLN